MTNKKISREDSSTNMQQDTELNHLHWSLKKMQSSIIRDLENHINDVVQNMYQRDLRRHEFGKFTNEEQTQYWNNRGKAKESTSSDLSPNQNQRIQNLSNKSDIPTTQNGAKSKVSKYARTLPDKVFRVRESFLTALLEVEHMNTIYHIFYIIMIMFLLNAVCYDFFAEGRVNFGLETFKAGLSKIHWVFGVWLLEHVFVLLLFYGFCGWATIHDKLGTQNSLQRFWSHSCLIVYISSQVVFLYVPSTLCIRFDLPFVSASILLLETTRLLMKMHAFVRCKAERILVNAKKTNRHKPNLPRFQNYLYFLFAPTLIYRDAYPRTTQIRWKFAINRFLEIVAIAFLYSFIHQRHIRAHFKDFGQEELNASKMIVKFFGMMLPSAVIFLCGFYMILHSWLNFTAELLRFGDRMFYKDWWTSHTFDAFYRDWNVVVHDWLYEYIYKDFYMYIFKGSKVSASLIVFFISAIVHEHVLGFALQLFFPVMFFLFFIVGITFIFITRQMPKNLGNILIWFALVIGNGTLISSYSMEYYARQNCLRVNTNWIDYLKPAILSCYKP